jgi:Zn-dependent protease
VGWKPIAERQHSRDDADFTRKGAHSVFDERRRRIPDAPVFPRINFWAVGSVGSLAANYWYLEAHTSRLIAASLLLLLAIHETGHLVALRRYKVSASWPIFCPWLGALIIVPGSFKNTHEEAWSGLSGPLAGVGATVCCYGLAVQIESSELMLVVQWSYLVNLFNLMPAAALDGGRIAAFVGRWLWLPAAVSIATVVFLLPPPQWYNQVAFVLLLLLALYHVCLLALEWGGIRASPAVVERTDSRRTLLVWLGLTWAVCLGGLAMSKMHGL